MIGYIWDLLNIIHMLKCKNKKTIENNRDKDKEDQTHNSKQTKIPNWLNRFSEIIKQDPKQLTESFAKEYFASYNGKDIYSKIINNTRCFTLGQIAYIDQKEGESFKTSYNRTKQRFFRSVKKGIMVLDVDYYEVNPGDRVSLGEFEEKIYITIHSMGKLLFNAQKSKELFFLFWNTMANKVNQISLGQTYMLNKKRKLVDQVLGDPKKNFVDCMGWRYSSKGEMLIAEVLHKLGIKFLINTPINLSPEVKEDVKLRFNLSYPYQYINADFLVLTEPRTVMEYWGVENDANYDRKREIKTYIYEKEKIRLIDIEANEPQNKLGLKNRLEKLLTKNN